MQTEERGGIHIVHVSGPVNAETCERFWNQMDSLVNTPGLRIVLDCERLFFASSRGLSMLARCQQAAEKSGSLFAIAALSKQIVKSIELLGMGKMVEIHPTVFAAMQAVSVP